MAKNSFCQVIICFLLFSIVQVNGKGTQLERDNSNHATRFLLSGKKTALVRSQRSKKSRNRCTAIPLNWNKDPWLPYENQTDAAQRLSIPSLSQPFYNEINDVRATVSAASLELIFSTNGNWRSALTSLLNRVYFNSSFENSSLTSPSTRMSYLLTTSPPISVAQLTTGIVKAGNVMYINAEPHVVAAPGAVLNDLREANLTDDTTRTPFISTYGNVILKRKGFRKVKRFWDLKKIKPGRFASSDPAEGGSYNNYRSSVFDIALNNPENPNELNLSKIEKRAGRLQFRLFDKKGVATIGPPMHNSVPHMIASRQADVGLIFLHLAVTAMRNNPGVFSAIYLASNKIGETDDPEVLATGQEPLTGNRAGTFSFVDTMVPLNSKQMKARAAFKKGLLSTEFTSILMDAGLRRPIT